MTYKDQLEMILKTIEVRLNICRKELKHSPIGELYVEKVGKYKQYRRYYIKNGKQFRESIGKDPELIQQLKKKGYLEQEVRVLSEDLRILKEASEVLSGNEFETIINKLRGGMGNILPEDISISSESGLLIPRPTKELDVPVRELELTLGDIDPLEWAVMPYCENTTFLDGKKHVGMTGLHYRSRAELTLFEHIITIRKQPVHYDELVEINGEWFSPDGIAPNARGEMIVIEYMEMSDTEYVQKNERKLEAYRRKGFVPGRNLVIISCESNGFINMPKLDKILDAYLLT